jgi:folate-binding protein YgfZ
LRHRLFRQPTIFIATITTTDTMTTPISLDTFFSALTMQRDERHYSQLSQQAIEPADNMIAPLSHYGLLAISGPDTAKFLQGQTTCNLNEIDDDNSRPGAHCTPKGRMISNFQLARLDNHHYLLRMRRTLVENSRAVLAKYIVFSKAQQHNASDDYLPIGLSGDKAAAAIAKTFGALPAGLHRQVLCNGNIAIQMDSEATCFECWIRTEQLTNLWPHLSEGFTLQGSDSWELLCIRRGLGDVTEPTIESFTPQMLNYQHTGGISFTKGCYTGQEVIARLHYKGTLKRHMYRIHVEQPHLKPGDVLLNSSTAQVVGDIVNAVTLDSQQTEALAVLTIKDVEEDCIVTASNGAKVTVLSLPYAITSHAF